ncbi:Gfo/Idh/MocA family protein [Magnetospira sp. QH-2]|uniref:Gfo/Idh/MocA family protein n=1 Tax=Magnetospira sp. (strain QH-2) TaxID=1288970 RepID=UPI0003E80B16|nr:Gfo/Idh/MocA family oxidoreductase [Magnetospira sp. QH-2]CCQ75524.1 conserved protein of unknown function [Magnetospira sp. QH-2]
MIVEKALVVGYGSVGQRHARLLADRDIKVAVVSRRPGVFHLQFVDLRDALAQWRPNLLVIASKTHDHGTDIDTAADAGFDGLVLVEKPILNRPVPLPEHRFSDLRVGYNLRFHPVIQGLRRWLVGSKILGCQIHAGQYLPDWRPGTDHLASYSAHHQQGGGVLRDLSHELDLILWLFGPWKRMTALGGRHGDVTVDSEDSASLLIETDICPNLSLHMNYLDQPPRRTISVQTDEGTVVADLVAGTLAGTRFEVARDDTYRALHEDILTHGGQACDGTEALAVTETIAAAEQAMAEKRWITR